MPDPAVVIQMRSYKAALQRQEAAQMREMAQRWLQVERRLVAKQNRLIERMAEIHANGGTVTESMLINDERYRALMAQLAIEMDKYTNYAQRTIVDRQRQLARLGIVHAQQSIAVQGVSAGFGMLPIEAVEFMAGLAGNGSPLRTLLVNTWGDAAEGLTDELIAGIGAGLNPREVARNMRRGSTRSLHRMMTVARTEQLRVYRMANLESYRASGVVTSYIRVSARDSRVCAGCLAADGDEYDLATNFQSHPQCRCSLVPKVEGIPLKFQRGSEWFEEQPVKTQREILGPGRYDLWASGSVDFHDFATVRRDLIWGDAIVTTPLRELTDAR